MPIGPFQKIVRAFLSTSENFATVRGPMSSAFCFSVNPFETSTTLESSSTTSTGRTIFADAMRFATSIDSLSTSDAPMLMPFAARKVFAIPPPTSSVSAFLTSASSGSILPAIFAPPNSATNGRSEASVIFCRNSISLASSRPPALLSVLKSSGSASIDACTSRRTWKN